MNDKDQTSSTGELKDSLSNGEITAGSLTGEELFDQGNLLKTDEVNVPTLANDKDPLLHLGTSSLENASLKPDMRTIGTHVQYSQMDLFNLKPAAVVRPFDETMKNSPSSHGADGNLTANNDSCSFASTSSVFSEFHSCHGTPGKSTQMQNTESQNESAATPGTSTKFDTNKMHLLRRMPRERCASTGINHLNSVAHGSISELTDQMWKVQPWGDGKMNFRLHPADIIHDVSSMLFVPVPDIRDIEDDSHHEIEMVQQVEAEEEDDSLRAGSDKPLELPDSKPTLTGGCCTARALYHQKYGTKCSLSTDSEELSEKLNEVESKVKQCTCLRYLAAAKSGKKEEKCTCEVCHAKETSESSENLAPTCSCHQVYESGNEGESVNHDTAGKDESNDEIETKHKSGRNESLRAGMDSRFDSTYAVIDPRFDSMYAFMDPRFNSACGGADLRFNLPHAGANSRFDSLQAGMDPRCKPPPVAPIEQESQGTPDSSGASHDFNQRHKFRSVDKTSCGTYDIIDFEANQNMSYVMADLPDEEEKTVGGRSKRQAGSNRNGKGSGSNGGIDKDHVVHWKYRNIDKSACGDLDVQEGEQRDIRMTILPGQCMRGGMDKTSLKTSQSNNTKVDANAEKVEGKPGQITYAQLMANRNRRRKDLAAEGNCSKNNADILRLRGGMSHENNGDHDYNQRLKFRSADRTVCGTYDIVEVETLENIQYKSPPVKENKPSTSKQQQQQPPSMPKRTRCGQDAPLKTTRRSAGMDLAVTDVQPALANPEMPDADVNLLKLLNETLEKIPVDNKAMVREQPSPKIKCAKSWKSSGCAGFSSYMPMRKVQSMDCNQLDGQAEDMELAQMLNFCYADNACGSYDSQRQFQSSHDSKESSASMVEPLDANDRPTAGGCPTESCLTSSSDRLAKSNDVDYYAHRKCRNVDKDEHGQLDLVESEQRDIRVVTQKCPGTSQQACPPPAPQQHHQGGNCHRSICPKGSEPSKPSCPHAKPTGCPHAAAATAVKHVTKESPATPPKRPPRKCPSPPCSPDCPPFPPQACLPCYMPCPSACCSSPCPSPPCTPPCTPPPSPCGHTSRPCPRNESDCSDDDEMKSVELSGMLKQEIRRLRKLNEEALAMVSAAKCSAKPLSNAKPLICEGDRSGSSYCKQGDSGGQSGNIPDGKSVNFHVMGSMKANKDGELREEDMTITSMQIMSGCDDYKPGSARKETLSSPSVKEPGEEEPADEN